jgi:DNA-binding transcriptional ArsR family regulator
MARRHPLADLLGEGLVTGLSLYAVWRWLLRPLGRGLAHLSWRWRRLLGPLWVATGLELVALLWRAEDAWTWPVALVLPVLGTTLALVGPRLSARLSGTTLALVPDSLRAGRRGVLDRPAERTYLALLLAYVGGWLALRVGAGASAITEWGWLAGWAGFGGTWWWHRRIRVAGRVDRYARRFRKLADKTANPKFKVFHGAKVVGAAGTRRSGVCQLTVRLAHGHTAEDVVPILPAVASWYHLRRNAVTLAEDEGNSARVTLRFMPRDPWRGKIPHPMPEVGSITLAGLGLRIPVGVLADGSHQMWTLVHTLIVGRNGSGKSVLLESILMWLLAALDAVVVGADMASGATLGVFRRALALPLAEDWEATTHLLERVLAVVMDRESRLGAAKEASDEAEDAWAPSPQAPYLFVIIDEYPDWVAECAERGTEGKRALAMLGRIGKRSRKTGVWLILAAQNGSKTDVGSKELQAQLRAVFGLALDVHANRVLWKDLVRQGWSSLGLRPGQHMLRDDEHTVPEVAKGFFVDVRARRAQTEAAAVLGKVLEPTAWAALMGTEDAELAAGSIVPAPEVVPVDPILEALGIEAATAAELVERTGMSRATVFRRLRTLKGAGLVEQRGDGVWGLVRTQTPVS